MGYIDSIGKIPPPADSAYDYAKKHKSDESEWCTLQHDPLPDKVVQTVFKHWDLLGIEPLRSWWVIVASRGGFVKYTIILSFRNLSARRNRGRWGIGASFVEGIRPLYSHSIHTDRQGRFGIRLRAISNNDSWIADQSPLNAHGSFP